MRHWLASAVMLAACAERAPEERRVVLPARSVALDPPSAPDESLVAVALTEQAAELASVATGRLELRVKPGAEVNEGALLARVIAPEVKRAAAEARAQLRQATAEVSRAEAELKQAESKLANRAQEGVVSRDERQAAESAVRIAQASLTIAQEKAAQAREREEAALYKVEQLDLVAPFSGVLSLWYRSDKSVVEAGSKLGRFIGQSQPIIRFAVPAPRAATVAVGDSARFVWERGEQNVRVSRVATEADPHSGFVIVEATLSAGSAGLRPGTAGRIHFGSPSLP